jgi:hypothetical protein
LKESHVSLAGLDVRVAIFHAATTGRGSVGTLVVGANISQERVLDGTLVGITVSGGGSDVRNVRVGRIEVGGGLSNGMFPSISLRAGSALGNLRRVLSSAGCAGALGDGAIVVNGAGSGVVVLFDALNEVELLELIGDDVESTSLNLVPVAFSGAVLAAESIVTGGS